MPAILEALNVDPKKGIYVNSLTAREARFGTHYKPPPTRTSFFALLLGALDDFMLKILLVCAALSMLVDGLFNHGSETPWWIEGVAILSAVAVVSIVTAVSDYQKEGEFLNKQEIEERAKTVTVLRENGDERI